MRPAALLSILVCLLAVFSGASARTYSSGGSCKAVATTEQEAKAKDACLVAIAKAVSKGCSAQTGKGLVKEFAGIFRDTAYAIVHVTTKAYAECSTYGNAYGCAAGKAKAAKYAEAQFKLFAAAFAEAFNKCPDCDPQAAAEIKTSLLIKLSAAAYATAKAGVCVGPNQTAKAVAYEDCYAVVLAYGFAKACATALIKGNCISQGAIAEVSADLRVDTETPYCACNEYKYTNGGWVQAKGNAKCRDWQVY